RLLVHLVLLSFTALFLPRSSSYFVTLPAAPSSLDRPEPLWLQPLTASPLLTLVWLCAGTTLTVLSWCGSLRAWVFFERVPNAKLDEALMKRWNEGRPNAIRDAAVATLASTVVFYIVATFFGAPLATYHLRTVLLSLLISLLAVCSPAYALGLPLHAYPSFSPTDPHYARWARLFAALSPMPNSAAERHMLFASAGTVLGAWVGAFPIALDWDRPWQAWPLTPAFGSIAGYIGGSLVGLALNVVKSQ
ncbi:GPI biosynthesis protein family Pig-F-domain-containing protein, partial [Auriculariales sp. MPI-PUGE-AT-0066]